MQQSFNNAQSSAQVLRRFRPTRSVVTFLGLVCVLLVIFSWSSSSGPPPPPHAPAGEPSAQEERLHQAAKAVAAPIIPPSGKRACEGMSCFAYSQYATHVPYLCNAVMMFESLHRLGSAADRVLLYNQDWEEGSKTYAGRLLSKAKNDFHVKLVPVKVSSAKGDWTWQESFTKLYAFSQIQYKRILALDSDSVLLQHMDDLFQAPPAKLSATIAYWLNDIKLSSNVLLLEPSQVEFDRIMGAIGKRANNEYDTEIVNKLFGGEASLIPHRTNNLITGEFRSGGNHTAYLGDDSQWNATAVLEEARFVHFSDLSSPKPWTSENPEDVKNTVVPCWKHPDHEKEDCTARVAWLGLYKEHMRRRLNICNAL